MRRADEQKARKKAQKTKDGAMSGTGVGWSMGLGYGTSNNHNLFCASLPIAVPVNLATCRLPRNYSTHPAAFLCLSISLYLLMPCNLFFVLAGSCIEGC